MANKFEWIIVQDYANRDIGMIGFIGGDAVAIAAFYDGRDGNRDGKVSIGERLAAAASFNSLKDRSLVEVAMSARHNPLVYERDPSFNSYAGNLFASFAAAMGMEAVWLSYFKPGVSALGRSVAQRVTDSMIKQLVIRKGFEKAARSAFAAVAGV
ncbi:MAG: hypothetical protein Q4G24_15865 [Paracoccus sp. (in: a-proteobacteria)]|uniref:hypothetical protein n=1 Tax=Paracoccus sp. TaxID=267 RepID=UPI0026DEFD72|nr:hypothetical protein [Paracoccus sp. (in: a-proteobacteria)]MDO5622923.1 hypothetical protein [Paracoccus sp. (in: a-proteobacteria)]